MRGLPSILAEARRAGANARCQGLKPYHPETLEDLRLGNPEFAIPVLGTYVPPGWKRTDDIWFVDATGLGTEDEPALTLREFVLVLRAHFLTHPTAGYAVVCEGPFQVYVAAFEKLPPDQDEAIWAGAYRC